MPISVNFSQTNAQNQARAPYWRNLDSTAKVGLGLQLGCFAEREVQKRENRARPRGGKPTEKHDAGQRSSRCAACARACEGFLSSVASLRASGALLGARGGGDGASLPAYRNATRVVAAAALLGSKSREVYLLLCFPAKWCFVRIAIFCQACHFLARKHLGPEPVRRCRSLGKWVLSCTADWPPGVVRGTLRGLVLCRRLKPC
jgi:hypothetical protein